VGTLRAISAAGLRASIRASGAKGAIVNAWASWCGPCRDEVPMLQGLARNLKAQHIDVILVSMDEPEDDHKALAFLRSFEISLPAYVAERPLGAFKQGIHPHWPGMIPATFLFDAAGKARYFWGGPVEESEIVPVVEGFLAGKAIDGESDFTLAPGRVEH
jgi:thiol-disulfide isomerase/thioredoxin